MCWSILTPLLDELANHSTVVGKIWVTLLVVLRIVLTAVGGELIYFDDQSNFVCKTEEPGCANVCYDAFAPLSHVRFCVFQVITISIPSVLYLGYAVHKIARKEDGDNPPQDEKKTDRDCGEAQDIREEDAVEGTEPEEEKDAGEKPRKKHDGRRRIKRDGLMNVYVLQLLSRAVLEIGFLIGQYVLYGLQVAPSYECTRSPCPDTVACYVSRPREKTIFLIVMHVVSALCLLVTVLEILHLCVSGVRDCLYPPRQPPPREIEETSL